MYIFVIFLSYCCCIFVIFLPECHKNQTHRREGLGPPAAGPRTAAQSGPGAEEPAAPLWPARRGRLHTWGQGDHRGIGRAIYYPCRALIDTFLLIVIFVLLIDGVFYIGYFMFYVTIICIIYFRLSIAIILHQPAQTIGYLSIFIIYFLSPIRYVIHIYLLPIVYYMYWRSTNGWRACGWVSRLLRRIWQGRGGPLIFSLGCNQWPCRQKKYVKIKIISYFLFFVFLENLG